MAVLIDTNILVYAHREDAEHHQVAVDRLRALAVGTAPVGLAWPCLYEFLRVVTHPRVFSPASKPSDAWQFVRDLLEMPSARLLAETERHAEVLGRVLDESGAAGNLVHDAHVVALAIEHGFDEILTEDRDFHSFAGVRAVRLRT